MSAAASAHYFTFLSMGQVLSRSFEIFVDRLDVYLTISGLVHLPAIILVTLIVLALRPSSAKQEEYQGDEGSQKFVNDHKFSILFIVWTQAIVSKMVTIAGEGGMVRAAGDTYCGRAPEWYPSLMAGLRKFLPLLGATLLVWGSMIAISFAAFLVVLIFAAGANSELGFIFILLALAVGAVACVAVLCIMVIVVPLFPIIIIEEKGPMNALRRCVELSKGRHGYFFVSVLMLWIMQFIFGQLLKQILTGGDVNTIVFSPMGIIISFVPHLLYVPLDTILRTVLYNSVRVDKEGLNQEILQRELAAPVEYAPPVSDYRRVALVDDRQQPNVVPSMSADDDEYLAP